MIALALLFAIASPQEECLIAKTDQILASDVAPAIPEFSRLPPRLFVGYAPAAGARRVFHAAELARIAKNRGVELAVARDVCFSWRMTTLANEDLAAAMRTALAIPEAKVEILDHFALHVPEGEIVFPRTGLQTGGAGNVALWRGYVQYGGIRRFTIWAKARITAVMGRVVAARDIQAGAKIDADQVRLETFEASPLDQAFFHDPGDVIGAAARLPLTAGSALLKNQIERIPDVAARDMVQVHVESGAASLTLTGQAQSSGSIGSTILVRNVASGRTFRAQISGKDQVIVSTPALSLRVEGGKQ